MATRKRPVRLTSDELIRRTCLLSSFDQVISQAQVFEGYTVHAEKESHKKYIAWLTATRDRFIADPGRHDTSLHSVLSPELKEAFHLNHIVTLRDFLEKRMKWLDQFCVVHRNEKLPSVLTILHVVYTKEYCALTTESVTRDDSEEAGLDVVQDMVQDMVAK